VEGRALPKKGRGDLAHLDQRRSACEGKAGVAKGVARCVDEKLSRQFGHRHHRLLEAEFDRPKGGGATYPCAGRNIAASMPHLKVLNAPRLAHVPPRAHDDFVNFPDFFQPGRGTERRFPAMMMQLSASRLPTRSHRAKVSTTMISQRAFVAGSVTLLATPLAVLAQQPRKVPRIGVLASRSPEEPGPSEGFRQGLRELG